MQTSKCRSEIAGMGLVGKRQHCRMRFSHFEICFAVHILTTIRPARLGTDGFPEEYMLSRRPVFRHIAALTEFGRRPPFHLIDEIIPCIFR